MLVEAICGHHGTRCGMCPCAGRLLRHQCGAGSIRKLSPAWPWSIFLSLHSRLEKNSGQPGGVVSSCRGHGLHLRIGPLHERVDGILVPLCHHVRGSVYPDRCGHGHPGPEDSSSRRDGRETLSEVSEKRWMPGIIINPASSSPAPGVISRVYRATSRPSGPPFWYEQPAPAASALIIGTTMLIRMGKVKYTWDHCCAGYLHGLYDDQCLIPEHHDKLSPEGKVSPRCTLGHHHDLDYDRAWFSGEGVV